MTDPRDAIFATEQLEQGLTRKAGEASVVVLGIAVLKLVQQLLSIALVARLVGPDEYGVFAMALPAVMIGMALSHFGLPQAIVQRRSIDHAHVSTLFWANLGFSALAALALVALADPAAVYYDEPRVKPVFQAISLSLMLSAVAGLYIGIMRRALQIRRAEIITLMSELIGIVVVVIGALAGLSYWALVLQYISIPLSAIVMMAFATGWLPSPPQPKRFRDALESLNFGAFVAGYSILNRVAEYSGTFITGALFGTAATGLFYRTRNLAGFPSQRVMIALSGVFMPTMSRLQDNPAELRIMFTRLVSRTNLIMLPLAVLIAAGAEPIVAIMLGQQWTAAAPLLLWMSVFTFYEAGRAGLEYALLASGRSRALFVFAVLRLIAIGTIMVIAGRYGLQVMTIAYAVAELCIALPLIAVVAHRCTPISLGVFARACLFDMALALVLGGALLLFVVPWIAPLAAVLELLLLGLCIGAFYAVRVAFAPDMRRDVLGILTRIRDRIRPRRSAS